MAAPARDGRKGKKVICVACNGFRAIELKVMPSVRLARIGNR
jgi:hypothetical protein